MNTFGPFDWWAYYKRRFTVDDLLAARPCRRCPRNEDCIKSIDPDSSRPCWRYIKWIRQIWPLVTGKKKTAPRAGTSEDGRYVDMPHNSR